MLKQLFLFSVIFGSFTSFCVGVIIDTKLGKIEGSASKTINGNPISSFMGIPYAKPPVGQLRFRKPVPAEPWDGTFEADQQITCSQNDEFFSKDVVGQEDCLVLNVYVPGNTVKRNDNDLLPVMVFIHGGGFFIGSGLPDFYGPERLLDYDVVLVTINYRLGPLGFMSTSNDDMPANLGLWDQNQALKWVQKNIKEFGGNPQKVTIFGESAGSMSVMYHYLSPQSKGLFQGAIAQSGPPTSVYLKVDKNPVYYARSLAEKVGCNPKATTQELTNCLREVDFREIQKLTMLFPQASFTPHVFKPYIDDFSKDPFIPKDPWEMIESGEFNDVPLIMGNNNDEGLMTSYNYYSDPNLLEDMIKRWDNELGPLFIAAREADEIDSEILELSKEVSNFAFPGVGRPSQETVLSGFKDIISDTIFNAVGTITARKIAEKSKSNVYEYIYKHVGTIGFSELLAMKPWKILLKYLGQWVGWNLFTPEHGVAHADELFMLFKFHIIPIEGVFTDKDKATSKSMLKLWTDFAKTGNPTPDSDSTQWKKLNSSNKERLEIGSGTLEMALDEKLEQRIEFWSKIWSKMPTVQRLKKSRTWSDPMLYGPTNVVKDSSKPSTKEEL